MNTLPDPDYKIVAKWLGPIFSLEASLTKHKQNMIFARNGTGKSFLSRALRYIDKHYQDAEKGIPDAAINLVSDEAVTDKAANGRGVLELLRGTDSLGKISLDRKTGTYQAEANETIFHVFSQDFVNEELQEQKYELDGNIDGTIAVDSDNIEIIRAQQILDTITAEKVQIFQSLRSKLNDEKADRLKTKAEVREQLGEYRNLTLESILENYAEKPAPRQGKTFSEILGDLQKLKSIPLDRSPIIPVKSFDEDKVNMSSISNALEKITSPSTVSAKIKEKIHATHDFYKTGTQIVQKGESDDCPFCEQNITGADPQKVIKAYIDYFNDAEAAHKSELGGLLNLVESASSDLETTKSRIAKQKIDFDEMKRSIPSQGSYEIDLGEEEIGNLQLSLDGIMDAINSKLGNLSNAQSADFTATAEHIKSLNKVIESNNAKVTGLESAIEESDNERRSIQREACRIFEYEFVIANWSAIEDFFSKEDAETSKKAELVALEKSAPSAKKKERVAKTFEFFLRHFFVDKYRFDKESFTILRDKNEMERGAQRTLSDGEKTVIAFCYFLAVAHKKVETKDDYNKLFFVFDDPVTSLSYDYIFKIAQTLKDLSVSNVGDGEISIDPDKISENSHNRPRLLIFTHSSYFFNIMRSSNALNKNATFSLHTRGRNHMLSNLMEYIAPFDMQLKHVHDVANGQPPEHITANSVRSVLEAVGRFCWPDKRDLRSFISFLSSEGIEIKSALLINWLSHGHYDPEESPDPNELQLACQEALDVVRKYAPGQISRLRE